MQQLSIGQKKNQFQFQKENIAQIKTALSSPTQNVFKVFAQYLQNSLLQLTKSILKKHLSQSINIEEKLKNYVHQIKLLRELIEAVLIEINIKFKQIISNVTPDQWSQQWQEYIEGIIQNDQKSDFDLYLKTNIEFIRGIKIMESARVKLDFQRQEFSKLLENLRIINVGTIYQALQEIQKNQIIRIHSQIQSAVSLKLLKILNSNKQQLQNSINQYIFSQEKYPIKFLYESIRRQCRELTIMIFKLSQCKFQSFTSNYNLQKLSFLIEQLISTKKSQQLDTLRTKIIQFFQGSFQMIETDAFNNLQKTLSMKPYKLDKERINNALFQIQKFDYKFQFCKQCQIYVKHFKSWWRGKLMKQNEVMYRKHWCFINYFIYTIPPGTVQYLHAQQQQKNKHMRFIMEKGQICFINFDQGYRYFIQQKLQEKIKLILDLCESLMQLQEHGINHNDITIRNTVKVGNKYKLIDYDVARMVNIEFHYSSYNVYHIEIIKQFREEIIKHTQYLMRKQLREDRVVSKTDPKNVTTPIENINRLAQYYNLPNQIELLKTLKQQNFRYNFSHEERFKIIFQYQKYIVGKRDCNKFALMIMKLIYDGNPHQKNYSYYLNSRVQQLIRDIQKGKDEFFIIDKYEQYFKIDLNSKEKSKGINAQFLKLLTQLITPQVDKRIPIKYFYYRIFQIFSINKYPLKIKPLTPKQGLPRYLNEKLINIASLMDRPQTEQRKKLIQIIQNIFRKNIQYSVQYHEKTMKIYDQLYTSLANPNQLQIYQQKPQANHGQKQPIVKEQRPNMCQIHKLTIQAQCCQVGCKKKWLCSECLYSLLFTAPDVANPLSHCKKINFSVTQPTLDYHKIIHLSEQKGHSQKIICLLVNKSKCNFKCRYCLQNTNNLDYWDKIYYVDMQKRIIYDCFNRQQLQNPTPKLVKQTYYKNSALYNSIFDNINSNLTRDEQEELQSLLEITKTIVQNWIIQIGKIHNQYIYSMHSNSKFQKINTILDYIGKRPYLLKQLRNKKHTDLQETIKLYELKEKGKDKNTDNDINLFNICQYLLDQINIVSQKLYETIQASFQKSKQKRQLYMITSPKAQDGYNLTQDIRKRFVSNKKIADKIQPSTKTLLKRQQRKKQQQLKKQQLQQQIIQVQSSMDFSKDNQSTKPSNYKQKISIVCQKCSDKSQNQKNDLGCKILALCTEKKCKNPFVCKNCFQEHKKMHQQEHYYYYFHDQIKKQTKEEIDQFYKILKEPRNYLKIQKLIQKIVAQVGVEVVKYIQFIQEMVRNLNSRSLKQIIFQTLKKYIIEENVNKFNGILWIVMQFFKDIPKFMKILVYSTQRYISQIKKATAIFKQTNKMLEKIEKDSFQTSQEWLTQKYKSINNNNNQDKPMLFYDINKRHWHRVQQLSIENIKQTNNDYAETKQKIKNLERNQLVKKLIRHHYNNLEVHIYWANFKSNRNHRLDFIQKFKNLKKIFIKDQPNYYNPAIFKSIDIQGLLNQVNQLKQMKLHCFNGFDVYCYELLKKKHPNCIVQLDSQSQKVVEFKWYNQVFPKQIKINVPFLLQGELIEWFDNLNILRAQFCLLLTNNITIQNTMKVIEETNIRQANRLKLIFNTLRQYDQDDKNLSLYNVKQHFWCRIAFGTPKSNKIEQQINKKYSKLMPIFNPIKSKFINIRYLTLHGVLINGGINQLAQAIQQNLKDFLSSLKVLQTLEIIKCFGLTFSILFQNLFTLKRLIIQQAVFRSQTIDKFPQFIQLQCLILRRVGLFQIASNGKLQSRQFGRTLSKFKFSTLQTLIINEFYQLENRQLQWIKKCPIKRLSLQRCFKINIEIYALIKSMTQLQHFDFTDTDIELKLFKQKMQVDGNFSKKVTIYNEIGNIQDSTIHNTKLLKQLMRITNYYEIKQLQQAFNKDQLKPLPLDLQQIKQVTIENKKIRQRNQYYILQIISKLPQLENIILKNCQWKNTKINKTQLTYNNFCYIPQLSKLKELSLIKANLKKYEQTQIYKYQYLRKLVLRENPYLEDILNLQFRQLVLLDLSQTGTKNILFDLKKVPRLKLINIQRTNIRYLPTNILQSKSIRIILTSLGLVQSYSATNKAKSLLFIQDIQNLGLFEGGQIADSLADIKSIRYYETLNQKEKNSIKHINKENIIKYNNTCLCFSEKEIDQLNRSKSNYELLIKYELFNVEMEVKGKRQWYDQFCQQLIQQQQFTKKQEDIQYQLMKIDSINYKKGFTYKIFTIQQHYQYSSSALSIINFERNYEIFDLISRLQQKNPFAQYGAPVCEFKNDKISNFIIKKPEKYTIQQRMSQLFKSISDKTNEFLKFLQEFTQKINELNILNPILPSQSIGVYKNQQICQFKMIDLSKCIYISSNKQSSIYQLIKFIIINTGNQKNYKQSLDLFKQMITYNKNEKYLSKNTSIKELNKNCNNQLKLILQKIDIIKLSLSLQQKINKEQTIILSSYEQQQLSDRIQEIIFSLLAYKRMANNLQLAILQEQIQQMKKAKQDKQAKQAKQKQAKQAKQAEQALYDKNIHKIMREIRHNQITRDLRT